MFVRVCCAKNSSLVVELASIELGELPGRSEIKHGTRRVQSFIGPLVYRSICPFIGPVRWSFGPPEWEVTWSMVYGLARIAGTLRQLQVGPTALMSLLTGQALDGVLLAPRLVAPENMRKTHSIFSQNFLQRKQGTLIFNCPMSSWGSP